MPASAHRFLAVQAVFDSTTALPKDRTVNTFHFYKGDDTAWTSTQLTAVESALGNFYRVAPAGSTATQMSFFGVSVASTWTIKSYDLMDPPPRVPLRQTAGGALTVASTTLPKEVALCLSFEAAKVSGLNQRNRRGRIFFGPLANNTSGIIDNNTGRPLLSTNGCVKTLALNGGALKADSGLATNGISWGVYSAKLDSFAAVADGWVDNEFDTQRRRGNLPTTRQTF